MSWSALFETTSIVFAQTTVGTGSIVAAGALLPERMVVPPGSLVMGSPGKVKRLLTGIDQASIDAYAQRYVEYKNIYKEEVASGE